MIQPCKDNPDNWPDLVSCGILKNEIKQIIANNKWPVNVRFLDSSLHIDLDKLSTSLTTALSKCSSKKKVVIYGTCHPKMDEFLSNAKATRTCGQNCVELLLGKDRFSHELSKGAFFLFEDWATRWETISYNYFGDWNIMKEIFQDAHKYILCIRTPCSGNFEKYAKQVSKRVGLPLIWDDFDLILLEKTLKKSIFNTFEENDV